MADKIDLSDLLELTADVVSSHVSNNSVAMSDLPQLIRDVHGTLAGLAAAEVAPKEEKPTPAVPIKKSVTPEHLVCLEDGKKLKMLKRYLKTNYDMSPQEYRERWGLPADYPMVAPSYAAQRSELAKQIGLGTSRGGRKGKKQ